MSLLLWLFFTADIWLACVLLHVKTTRYIFLFYYLIVFLNIVIIGNYCVGLSLPCSVWRLEAYNGRIGPRLFQAQPMKKLDWINLIRDLGRPKSGLIWGLNSDYLYFLSPKPDLSDLTWAFKDSTRPKYNWNEFILFFEKNLII